MAAKTSVEQLLCILDHAFDGTDWHSLLGNLRSVTPEDWLWVPEGGRRSIRDIVMHVGACKFMYENHAFGGASLKWDDPLVSGEAAAASTSIAAAVDWLRQGQETLRRSIAALDDEELVRLRKTNWGQLKETRWIIDVMIEHDLYHAGEINHIRCLHQQNDE